ncbi:unnamed protein product, partial [Arabidopsis halleri]
MGMGPLFTAHLKTLGDPTRATPSPQELVLDPSIGLGIYPELSKKKKKFQKYIITT